MPPTLLAADLSDPLQSLRAANVEHVLLPLLWQLAIILVAARLGAALFRWLRQPAVVGEIAAGLMLGPSLLGWVWPGAFAAVFYPVIDGLSPQASDVLLHWIITAVSQLGLVLLLFLVGLEFDFSHLRWHGASALAISVSGMAAPFALGIVLALWIHPRVAADVPVVSFTLFMATALSITAIPVLGRIMMELNITRTRLGAITISSAAANDAAGWILLATVAALVRGELSLVATVTMAAATVGFGLAMIFIARPLLRRWAAYTLERGGGELSLNSLAILLSLILLCAIATNLIGIFAIFGAFLLGAILSSENAFREAVNRRLRDLVTVFFLPIFFTYTGLRTQIGTLESWQLWGIAVAVIALAIAGKLGGCGLAARLTGSSWRESGCIGAMMNTRGLMELIVINVGKDLGVIPDSVFCIWSSWPS